jgi:hypothetical protein
MYFYFPKSNKVVGISKFLKDDFCICSVSKVLDIKDKNEFEFDKWNIQLNKNHRTHDIYYENIVVFKNIVIDKKMVKGVTRRKKSYFCLALINDYYVRNVIFPKKDIVNLDDLNLNIATIKLLSLNLKNFDTEIEFVELFDHMEYVLK